MTLKYKLSECVVSRDLEPIEIDERWAEKAPKDPMYREPWFNTVHHGRIPSDITDYLVKEYSAMGDWTADTVMGSGTFGCSALLLGRNFIGNEIDPGFMEDTEDNLDAARSIFNTTHSDDPPVKHYAFTDDARTVDLARWEEMVQLGYVSPATFHAFGTQWHTKDKKNLNFVGGTEYFKGTFQIFHNVIRTIKPGGFLVASGRDFAEAKDENLPETWLDEEVPRLIRFSSMLLNFMLAFGMKPVVRYLVKSRSPWNVINHKKYGTPLIPFDTFVVCQK